MGMLRPIELRSRVVGFVKDGNRHRQAARHIRVSLFIKSSETSKWSGPKAPGSSSCGLQP